MAKTNPTLATREVIKIEADQFHRASMERNKDLKLEMGILVRERDLLKKEVNLLERTQKHMELEKCSVDEKLRRSERRCEELEENLGRSERRCEKLEVKIEKLRQKLSRSRKKCEELRRQGSDIGIGLSAEGGRNNAYSGIEDEGANAVTYPDSKRACVSNEAENNGYVHDNEVDWPEHRGATFRVFLQRRCNLIKIINDIKKNLDKENLKKFEESCFGHLLKTNKLTFQGQLIVQLLLHMDMNASNEKRLVFKINNSTMEFGPRDFFHITGLRLGELETTLTTPYFSTIHHSIFWGRRSITLKDIEEAFLNISTDYEGKGELTLKLALLNFLYGTLLAKGNNIKIEVRYLHLIEDLQKFDSFPWGQLAYEYLVSSLFEARIRMDTYNKVGPLCMDINGFTDALQAWAYEMMPTVAAHCASCLNNFEKITPWILRWSATKFFTSKNLKKFFAPADLKNTKGKKKGKTIPEEAKQKKRKILCEGSNPVLHAQPSSAATPPSPSMNASTYPLHHCTHRLSLHKEVDDPLLDDNLPRNETTWVDDEISCEKS